MSAPLGQALLVRLSEAAATASVAVVVILSLGALSYLVLCLRSSRQWNGEEERWVRPLGQQRYR
jgi:hypothetical protein